MTGMPEAQRREIAAIGAQFNDEINGRVRNMYAPHVPTTAPDVATALDLAYGEHPRQRLDAYFKSGGQGRRVLLYVPGGGFVAGDKRSDDKFYGNIGRWFAGQDVVVFTMNYRLAPEAVWPAGGCDVRDAVAYVRAHAAEYGGDPQKINPLVPVDLVIDHSVIVDEFGTPKALGENVALEYARNGERYRFLKWGQGAFDNFRVVPPGTGICHQVNLEYLAQTVWTKKEKYKPARGAASTVEVAYPDSLVGTDSHTTMVNGLSVLGWGVGGIEAEACMLGQPLSMLLPEVIGFRLDGSLKEGVTATDLVLTVTQMLRKKGVVGKFVEFYGPA